VIARKQTRYRFESGSLRGFAQPCGERFGVLLSASAGSPDGELKVAAAS
jgi:hypothetical protein